MNWNDSRPVMDGTGLQMLKRRRRNRAGLLLNRVAVTVGLVVLVSLLLSVFLMASGHMHPSYQSFTENGTTYRVFTLLLN